MDKFVILGQYKGLRVPAARTEVSEEEVRQEIEKELSAFAARTPVCRPAHTGDTVVMDYQGEHRGKSFAGGTAADSVLELGSGRFIPGFEAQLEGVLPGEKRDVHVTYPNIPAFGEVAGEEVVFHVTVKEVQEKKLPVLDDAFAAEKLDAESADRYRRRIRARLERMRRDQIEMQKQQYVIQQAVRNAEYHIPSEVLEAETQGLLDAFAVQLAQSGIRKEEYLARIGRTKDDFRRDMRIQAEINCRQRLLLEAVAEAEGLTVREDEIEQEYRKIADRHGVSVREAKERLGRTHDELIWKDLVCQKALELLVRCCEEVRFS